MMDIAEGLKNVTVIEMKALISRNVAPIRALATECSHVGSNFKKFRKVCYPLYVQYRMGTNYSALLP
jgi:hypothetical protein